MRWGSMVTAHPEVQGIWALLYRQVVPCNRQKGAHVEVLSVVLLQEFVFVVVHGFTLSSLATPVPISFPV